MTITAPSATPTQADPTTTLQAQWYNALTDQLGLPRETFQLLQPTSPLGSTSALLWMYFNDLPPEVLVDHFTPGGGNQYYEDYRAVVSQLTSQQSYRFKYDIGDAYEPWLTYVRSLDPIPADLPEVFQSWAMTTYPDVAQVGANDLAAMKNDPVFRAQLAVQNTGDFLQGVPSFSQRIDDLRSELLRASGAKVVFDSASQSADVSNTWAGGGFAVLDFFRGSYDYAALNAATYASHVTVTAEFDHLMTFSADPGSWYLSSAFNIAYGTKDNTVWQPGEPDWESTFGPDGAMLRFTRSLVVADGITITVESDAEVDGSDQSKLENDSELTVWPYLGSQSNGGAAARVEVNGTTMTIEITAKAGNPVVLGANVVPVQTVIAHGR